LRAAFDEELQNPARLSKTCVRTNPGSFMVRVNQGLAMGELGRQNDALPSASQPGHRRSAIALLPCRRGLPFEDALDRIIDDSRCQCTSVVPDWLRVAAWTGVVARRRV